MRRALSRGLITAAATTGAVALGAGCATADAHADGAGSPEFAPQSTPETPHESAGTPCDDTTSGTGVAQTSDDGSCASGEEQSEPAEEPDPSEPPESSQPSQPSGPSEPSEPQETTPTEPNSPGTPAPSTMEPPAQDDADAEPDTPNSRRDLISPAQPESIARPSSPSVREGNDVVQTWPLGQKTERGTAASVRATRADGDTDGRVTGYTPQRPETPSPTAAVLDSPTGVAHVPTNSLRDTNSAADAEFGWFAGHFHGGAAAAPDSPTTVGSTAPSTGTTPQLAATGAPSGPLQPTTAAASAMSLVLGGALLYRRRRTRS